MGIPNSQFKIMIEWLDNIFTTKPPSTTVKIGEHYQCNTQFHYNMKVLKIKAFKIKKDNLMPFI